MTCSGLSIQHLECHLLARRWKIANALTLGRMRGLFELQYLIRDGRGG